MTSPYADRDRTIWTGELLSQIDDLHEKGIDFSESREVSIEFAGSPLQRHGLVEHFEAQGWATMRGIGIEPEATVLLVKSAAWTEDQLVEVQTAMLDAAMRFGCVFEGLCYHDEAKS